MIYITEQEARESSAMQRLRKIWLRFFCKRKEDGKSNEKENRRLLAKLANDKRLINVISKEIINERQIGNENNDLDIYQRMFEQLKAEINELDNQQVEVQAVIDSKKWKKDYSFQYQYVTKL